MSCPRPIMDLVALLFVYVMHFRDACYTKSLRATRFPLTPNASGDSAFLFIPFPLSSLGLPENSSGARARGRSSALGLGRDRGAVGRGRVEKKGCCRACSGQMDRRAGMTDLLSGQPSIGVILQQLPHPIYTFLAQRRNDRPPRLFRLEGAGHIVWEVLVALKAFQLSSYPSCPTLTGHSSSVGDPIISNVRFS